MSYVVKQSGKKYHIHQTEGDVTLSLFLTKTSANSLMKKLNKGSGFGQSPVPNFFCNNFKSVSE